ncbi:MAG: LacI family DNA-binding transcriptional regulator [Spirochaetales bacterium]|nr:LacI family DNA-binding transcriptional regulator [Spirochaetales bacterium]
MKQKNIRKLTIKDVAEIAKVSKGTVSRVLNKKPGVGDKTRKTIETIIKKLNYSPNLIAQNLASKKTGNIGVIIPHQAEYYLSNPYWPVLLSVITKAAATVGYTILLSTALKEGDIDSAYEFIIKGKRVDGIIAGSELLGEKQLSILYHYNVPFVLIGKSPFVNEYYVDIENRRAMEVLTTHLAVQGFRRILFICGPETFPSVKERVSGFYDALEKASGSTGIVCHTSYDKPEVKEIIQNQKENGFLPDALVVGASDLVLCTLMILRELNMNIPGDIGFASFDTLHMYEYFKPRITAIKQPIKELTKSAFEMLFALIAGKHLIKKSKILPCTLEIGESCREKEIRTIEIETKT